jgi:hypothetical protein
MQTLHSGSACKGPTCGIDEPLWVVVNAAWSRLRAHTPCQCRVRVRGNRWAASSWCPGIRMRAAVRRARRRESTHPEELFHR